MADASNSEFNRIYDKASQLRTSIEKEMSTKNMPPIVLNEEYFGQKIAVKPVKNPEEEAWNPTFSWSIQKGQMTKEKPIPQITAENITKADLSKSNLPRKYRSLADNEKGFLFRDSKGNTIGWAAISEYENSKKDIALDFIGVMTEKEDKGYGRAILNWLKNNYESIVLSAVAYDLGKRGYDIATERLRDFYKHNGFIQEAGSFGWQKNIPNLNDAKPGQTLHISERFHANNKTFYDSDIEFFYLQTLQQRGLTQTIFTPETSKKIDEWIKHKIEMIRISGQQKQ